jgi:hypothetical protein
MAVYTPKRFYINQPSTSNATLYTVTTGASQIIKNILLNNTTASDATITLNIVPTGGSASTTNRLLSAYTVKANDTVAIDCSIVMNSTDFVSGLQGTSGAITAIISGVEVV